MHVAGTVLVPLSCSMKTVYTGLGRLQGRLQDGDDEMEVDTNNEKRRAKVPQCYPSGCYPGRSLS